ncbi:MAG TPA: YitT family protein [Clostridiales bacterium]|nr:YitT family protein [Clostridiales bacterium]
MYISELFKPKEIGKTLGAILGTLVYAFGLNTFINPLGLYTGGVMGVSQIIRTILIDFLHLPIGNLNLVGIIFYLINFPLFFVAYKTMGKMFFARTMVVVASTSLFLTIIPVPQTFILANDTLAGCLIGAILCGVGAGFTLMMGACGGGTDIIGIYLIKKNGNMSIGKVNLFLNFFLYMTCFLLFDVKIVIYSILVSAIASIAMDKVHTQNINVEVTIITKVDMKSLQNEIMNHFDRGITKWVTKGAYTEDNSEILYIVLSKYEVSSLRRMVHKHDPNAFIVTKEGVWVEGNYIKKL